MKKRSFEGQAHLSRVMENFGLLHCLGLEEGDLQLVESIMMEVLIKTK